MGPQGRARTTKVAARRSGSKSVGVAEVERGGPRRYIRNPMVQLPLELPDSLVPFVPSAERTLALFGTTVHLALVPGRRNRTGHDREGRPAFQRSPAGRIIGEEAYWRSDTLALTPNKFPFARNQRILWMARPARDPDRTFWRAALDWVARSDGTVLLNNIGAAATIARAHAHLIDERLPFVDALPERPLRSDVIDVPDGCQLCAKDLPFCIVGVRGPVDGRAEALLRLADARLTPTWNVVLTQDAAWIVPRGKQTPAPHFATAMGAAEMWGRYCYVDEGPFASATAEDLRQALELATKPAID